MSVSVCFAVLLVLLTVLNTRCIRICFDTVSWVMGKVPAEAVATSAGKRAC